MSLTPPASPEPRPLFYSPSVEDGWIENRRYNRWERGDERVYEENHGFRVSREVALNGRVKVKLVHRPFGSVLFPDQLFLPRADGSWAWFQPMSFLPPLLTQFGDGILARFAVD